MATLQHVRQAIPSIDNPAAKKYFLASVCNGLGNRQREKRVDSQQRQYEFDFDTATFMYKKLSYRRRTARCVVSVEILPIATKQCRNYLYDKSWTKYQLSLIDPCDKIVFSGRASELGGVIDLVDRQRPSLSRSHRPPFSSEVDDTFRVLTIDMPWRNFLSPEFKTKFQREVPLFLEITEFPFNTV